MEVHRRISAESWEARVEDARERETIVTEILRRVGSGESQNSAISAVVPVSKRSATLRDLVGYRREGFEGLIDRRTPREPTIPHWVREAVQVARRANPSITVEAVTKIVQDAHRRTAPSGTTIKRIWNEAGLERPRGRPETPTTGLVVIEQLQAAGFQMLRAAEAETRAVERLVDTVMEVAEALPDPGPPPAKEMALRNPRGQLTRKYNRARRKRPEEPFASTHRAADEKAAARDLGRLQFRGQQRETIEQKVWGLVHLPGLPTLRGRIEDLRGPQGRLLQELCGYAYQAETVRKVVSEFTLAGLGPRLQQTQAETWHQVSVERWETDFRATVVYVDNNVKPLWTGLFTKCAKVSSTGRVQPALATTFINTGVGVPICFETHSGTAPLAPRVLKLLEQVEKNSEQPVGRLTVIDGECCSAALLKEFKDAKRDLVVPLPAPLVKAERFSFGPGSAFQPYRDNDRIREGLITLHDSKDSKLSVDARAIIIERRTKETWTVLVTLADPEVWSCRRLADAYFGRWPYQEGFFRRANQAVGLKQVHGYGKRVVVNTGVLTRIEDLDARIPQAGDKQAAHAKELLEGEASMASIRQEREKIARYRAKREERVDAGLAANESHTRAFATATAELRQAMEQERGLDQRHRTLEAKQKQLASRAERVQAQLAKWKEERQKLDGRREIIEADVSQDVLFTTMKLTLAMLVHFVGVEYMPHRPIEWSTFLNRIALLPGHRETAEDAITVTIYGNDRDIELMQALHKSCLAINARRLTCEGRLLQYRVDWPNGAPEGWFS
jgi:hypothetical protein